MATSYIQFDCRFQHNSGFALDLRFDAGQGITGLVGPSGSGKTTTLMLIAGLLRPQSGMIRIGENVLVDTRAERFCRPNDRAVGMVFQDFALFPHYTVEGNLKYGLRRRGTGGPTWEQVVETFELGNLLKRRPQSLSGGQQQRVAIARAVLSQPRVLLLDEPLSAQHMELKTRLGEYVRQVVDQFGLATILVSHDAAFLESLGCAMIRIDEGQRQNGGDDTNGLAD